VGLSAAGTDADLTNRRPARKMTLLVSQGFFSMPMRKELEREELDLSTPEKFRRFALSVERAGQRAVAKAIAHHKSLGNPIYYKDPATPDCIIKELADGRRFHIQVADDGSETLLRAVP
jgi:hypothetical protein